MSVHYVSLGAFCEVTHQLKRLRLKQASLPFDWAFAPLDFLNAALDILLRPPFAEGADRPEGVAGDFLDLCRVHQQGPHKACPHNALDRAEDILELERRAFRFRDLLLRGSEGTIVFIRKHNNWGQRNCTDDQMIALLRRLRAAIAVSVRIVFIVINVCDTGQLPSDPDLLRDDLPNAVFVKATFPDHSVWEGHNPSWDALDLANHRRWIQDLAPNGPIGATSA